MNVTDDVARDGRPIWTALLIGAAGGLAGGLLGVGGGLVMVPLMVFLLALPLKRAVGTSLAVVIVTSLVAVGTELVVAPGNLRWAAAAWLSAGAVVGSWIGAKVIVRTAPPLLAKLFAALLLVAALKMAGAFAWLGPAGTADGPAELLSDPSARAVAHVLTGLAAGVIASLFGIGGGILAVPALALLHPAWEFQACRATSLVMIVASSVTGAALHHALAQVDVPMVRSLVPGSVAGSIAGVLLANRLAERPLEIAFAVLLGVAAWRLVVGARRTAASPGAGATAPRDPNG